MSDRISEIRERVARLTEVQDEADKLASSDGERAYENTIRDLLSDLSFLLAQPDDQLFLQEVVAEIASSRAKFPAPDANSTAMVEEVGEVAKALMYEPWSNVRKECVQVAGCALRLALEGDCTMVEFRIRQGNSDMPIQR